MYQLDERSYLDSLMKNNRLCTLIGIPVLVTAGFHSPRPCGSLIINAIWSVLTCNSSQVGFFFGGGRDMEWYGVAQSHRILEAKQIQKLVKDL